jgi:predicted RNA binding protein YcfA (HicA-like mRNA interferase family)
VGCVAWRILSGPAVGKLKWPLLSLKICRKVIAPQKFVLSTISESFIMYLSLQMMKVGEIIKIIEKDGWYLVRQKGSHKQYKHITKSGLITIAFHRLSDDIAIGTLNNILKQAEITLKNK